ncbi:MAG: YggT family protein [Gammaproteobacteria bacterium]|nr:YggT family protein [Gammaproteobacteria bacterium]
MSGGYFSNAGVFLIQTVFGMYILAVLLRLLLQIVRADFYNPFSQFLVKITNPVLVPLRRVIPGLFGVDLASVLLLLALQMVKLALIGLLIDQGWHLSGLLLLAAADLLSLLLNVFLFSILIQVILSWVRPGEHNPLTALLYNLNEPLLAPARRILPPISGLDLSPIVVLVALQLASMLVVAPLSDLGRAFALG